MYSLLNTSLVLLSYRQMFTITVVLLQVLAKGDYVIAN